MTGLARTYFEEVSDVSALNWEWGVVAEARHQPLPGLAVGRLRPNVGGVQWLVCFLSRRGLPSHGVVMVE